MDRISLVDHTVATDGIPSVQQEAAEKEGQEENQTRRREVTVPLTHEQSKEPATQSEMSGIQQTHQFHSTGFSWG